MYLFYLIGGFVLVLFGLITIFEGGFSRYGVFAEGRIPGIAAIICGLISLRIGYKGLTSVNKNTTKSGDFLKCIGCGKVYKSYEVENFKCPRCANEVENLIGFFERHPQFKAEKGKTKKV